MAVTGLRRLNRRRYRESVKALKAMIADEKVAHARKLEAIKVLLGIFDRHDRSELQRHYRDRQQEKAREADKLEAQKTQTEDTGLKETPEQFLARIRARAEADALAVLLDNVESHAGDRVSATAAEVEDGESDE